VKKSLLIFIWSIMMLLPEVKAQSKKAVENYSILNPGKEFVWMPVIRYKGKKNFYTEARYNYEELNTGSLYMGRSFNGGKKAEYSVTPMLGIVFGKYNGASAALNTDIDYNRFNFSAQLQYTVNTADKAQNFFYNWSEISCRFLKKMYGGISIQQTQLYQTELATQTGLLLGFSSGKITVPVYLFNIAQKQKSLTAGIIYEWEK
jgi:hypothetical protein